MQNPSHIIIMWNPSHIITIWKKTLSCLVGVHSEHSKKNTDNTASWPRWPPISINTKQARDTTKNNNCFLPHQVFRQSRQLFPRAHHFAVPISSQISMIRSFFHQGTIQYGGGHPFPLPKISSIHFSDKKKTRTRKKKLVTRIAGPITCWLSTNSL
jgi:hypothetical protein